MGLKSLYNNYYSYIDNKSKQLERNKTIAAEYASLVKRRHMYKKVEWTEQQQKDFDAFWLMYYGKRISNKWHKIYQSINGQYGVDYIPEILYTTRIEYYLNDYRYARVLADKSLIETIATNSGCVVPETIAICSDGRFYDHKRNVVSRERICRDVKSINHDIVIKPTVNSSSGKNIRFIQRDKLTHIDKELALMGNNFIIQYAINPHPAFSMLNPSSINTLRVMTYILNDEIYHMPIACRMGSNDSKIDNIHAGGLVIGVKDSGQLLPDAYQLGYGDSDRRFTIHPRTNVVFEQVTLPCIERVIKAAYSAHTKLPRIGMVSWDFTVDKNENPVLIEANIKGQSIWFPQIVHGKGAFGDNTIFILELMRKSK